MENYPSYSYPESGDSSPRSREIDFENPPTSWEDSSTTAINYKVKFMVSYNGKIQPRTHDNLLSYVGGETKILAVDRNVRFSTIYSKLASLVSSVDNSSAVEQPPSPAAVGGFTFKYQLPGEDLDALISVTNDDDLEHMMHEYDRMCRGSSKPARLRLFIFPDQKHSSGFSSTSSDKGLDRVGLDRVGFVDALNSGPVNSSISSDHHANVAVPVVVTPSSPVQPLVVPPMHQPTVPVNVSSNNVDYLFGLDKGPVHVPVPVQNPVQVMKGHEPVGEPDMVQELNRLQISTQELHHHQQQQQLQHHHQQQQQLQHQQQQQQLHHQQQQAAAMFSKSDDNLAGNYADPYHKPPPQGNIQQIPAGYWQQVEQQQNHAPPQQLPQQPPQQQPQYQHHQQQQQQPVYMMHAPSPASVYHTPVVRPVAANQGYYQVQRMPGDQVYREQVQQPVYSTQPSATAVNATPQLRAETTGYTQVGYDSATGRQVYYAAAPQGSVVAAPYQGVPATAVVSGDLRSSGDGKVGQKVVTSPGAV